MTTTSTDAEEFAQFQAWKRAQEAGTAEVAAEPEPEPHPEVGSEAHNAVTDLLGRLRLDVSTQHLTTVFDWLKELAGDKTAADTATETPTSPTAETVGGAAAEGASSPIASGESTPAAAPTADPTSGAVAP